MAAWYSPAQERELRERIRREADSLASEFAGVFSRETIERFLDESFDRLAPRANVVDFIPVLGYRYARERLRALARAEGLTPAERPEVLFVCVHNAGRSQIAAALTARLSGGAVGVRSAGSDPASEINPVVVEVLRERGIDLSEEFPKPLADELVRGADAVITMGCGDACPIYPGKRYLDWDVPDPAGQPREVVEAIVAEIEARVRALLAELGVPTDAAG